MTETKMIQKIEIQTLLNNIDFKNPDPRKLFVIAVCDDKGNYQGYRLITDKIPENWNLFKVDDQLSLFPVVQGG